MKINKFNESIDVSNLYLKSVEVITDVNPLKAGVKLEIKKPICFIVGDNGVGKSTLLECVRNYYGDVPKNYMYRPKMKENIKLIDSGNKFNFKYIDFHGDDMKFASAFIDDSMGLQIQQMKASSGQVSISLLNNALGDLEKVKDGLIILDEPCRGQSIKNKWRVVRLITGLTERFNCQVILTTHSDTILSAFKGVAQYYDISLNADTTYRDFMISQLKD